MTLDRAWLEPRRVWWPSAQLWDLGTGTALCTFTFPIPLRAVTLDPLDSMLAVGGDNGRVYLVDLYCRPPLSGAAPALTAQPLSSSGVGPRTLTDLMETLDPTAPGAPRVLAGHQYGDPSRLSTNGARGGWPLTRPAPSASAEGGGLPGSGAVTAVAFAAEGGLLVSGSMDGTLIVWDVPFGQPLRTYAHHQGGCLRPCGAVTKLGS